MGLIGLWVRGYRLGLWVSVWLGRGYQRGYVVVVLWFVGISVGRFV